MYYPKCSLVHLSRKQRPLKDILAGVERPPEQEEEEEEDDVSSNASSKATTKKASKGPKKERARPITLQPIIRDNEDAIAEWMRSKEMLYNKLNKFWLSVDLKNDLYSEKATSLSKENPDEPSINGGDLQKYVTCMRTRLGKITSDAKKKKSGDSGKVPVDKEKTDRDEEVVKMWGFLLEHIKRQRQPVACGVSINV